MEKSRLDCGLQRVADAERLFKANNYKAAHALYSEALVFLEHSQNYEYPADVHLDLNRKIHEKIIVIKSMIDSCEKAAKTQQEEEQNNKGAELNGHVSTNGAKDKQSASKDPESELIREKLQALVVAEKPNVPMSKIAGLDGVKSLLLESIDLPRRFPNLFTGARRGWKGILFFGPPGTGKSFIAKAVATEVNCSAFFSITSASVMSKYVGESQKIIKELFALAKQDSTSENPAVIFFDEIDSFTVSRDDSSSSSGTASALNELLVQMQGFSSGDDNIIVLAATNLPHKLDSAIRRRFEKRIYIPLPDLAARKAMFKMYLGKPKADHILTDSDMESVAEVSEGYSGADIEVVCRDALMAPLRNAASSKFFKKVNINGLGVMFVACDETDNSGHQMKITDLPKDKLFLKPIKRSNLLASLQKTKRTVTQEQLKIFDQYNKEFGYQA
ncbi:MAG: Vacuolar protein sorting-associated protein 4B [Marteilia pararefringens]